MTRLRMTIAKRLKEAQEMPLCLQLLMKSIYEIISMRSSIEMISKKYFVKWVLSFFVKACILGLKNYPAINAEIRR